MGIAGELPSSTLALKTTSSQTVSVELGGDGFNVKYPRSMTFKDKQMKAETLLWTTKFQRFYVKYGDFFFFFFDSPKSSENASFFWREKGGKAYRNRQYVDRNNADFMLNLSWKISKGCENLIWKIEKWKEKKEGIPDLNVHSDCLPLIAEILGALLKLMYDSFIRYVLTDDYTNKFLVLFDDDETHENADGGKEVME